MEPRAHRLLGLSAGGFHEVAYVEWGPERSERTLLCVHGLTRNGRDFDVLAERLANQGWRVVCPDVVGRGRSGWLADPAGYGYPQYLSDMTALIARLDVESLDWLGTSMGGLIGMMAAAQPSSPVKRLVVNDVGPFIPKAALLRIAAYLGQAPVFPDIAALEAHLREIHAPFGALTDAQWRAMAEHSAREVEGGLALAYDPGIARAFGQGPIEDVDLWPLWEAVRQPVLVLRGAESDLLTAEVAQAMTERGPKAALAVFEGCGHAPSLMEPAQIARLEDWLAP